MGMNLVGWVDMAAGTRVILGYLRFAYLHEAPEIAKNNPGRDPNGEPGTFVNLSVPASLRSPPLRGSQRCPKPVKRYLRTVAHGAIPTIYPATLYHPLPR